MGVTNDIVTANRTFTGLNSSMAKSHDAIPFDRVTDLIGEAKPFRQSAVLHDAWREYAAKAVRPYAWKTFAQYARAHFKETGDWSPERGKEKLTPWQDGACASPRVLVLGAYAALRVRGGALAIEHGPHDDRATIGSISTPSPSLTRSFSTATASF